ncbi:MAG: hypothetical protein FWD73_06375 [Polyangiaceae bacterium]|nr:hypothetical protein [Polyangiaceae bacterium]
MSAPRRRFSKLFIAIGFAAGGCVLVEPPADLPASQPTRPIILHGSVVPGTSAVLGTFPAKFIVPVEITPVTASFEWAAFIDYNPRTGEGQVGSTYVSTFEPATTEDGVRLLEVSINPISISPPLDINGCHVIEVVVALQFVSDTDPHTPAPPGGDVVQWFYNPGGDMRGCPVADAGIDASVVGDEGSEDGEGGSP